LEQECQESGENENCPAGNEGLVRAAQTLGHLNPDSGELEASSFSDRPSATRQSSSLHYPAQRLTALRPCLAAGLPFRVRSQWKYQTVIYGQQHL